MSAILNHTHVDHISDSPGFLICYHLPANAGYAIEPLEIMFYRVVSGIVGSAERVHMGYRDYHQGKPRWLDQTSTNLITLSYREMSGKLQRELIEYISRNNIRYALAFDLPVGAPIITAFRKGGIKKIISYYGAPVSSFNRGIRLLMKRAQVLLATNKPDHFIFESYGMQRTATHGRGILKKHTSVVRLGIDVDRFSTHTDRSYIRKVLHIPEGRKIIIYAGHMEKRKGVDVILRAAAELVNKRGRTDVHFLLCGNRDGEERVFDALYKGTPAEEHITFGGYRNDIPGLMPGCYAAVIASTGWDSFPRSSLEMSAAGLPLLVSDLPGLNETVDNDVTGLVFTPGDPLDLSEKLEHLLNKPDLREQLSTATIERVKKDFSLDHQEYNLKRTIESVLS